MGLVASITAGFVRVRDEINIIKQALQNVSGAQPATTTQAGVARFGTQAETYSGNAYYIPRPKDIRDWVNNFVSSLLNGYVYSQTVEFFGDGTTTFFAENIGMNVIDADKTIFTVKRFVPNADPQLAYVEVIPASEIAFIRVLNLEAVFPDSPSLHMMFNSAPSVGQRIVVTYHSA